MCFKSKHMLFSFILIFQSIFFPVPGSYRQKDRKGASRMREQTEKKTPKAAVPPELAAFEGQISTTES